MDSIDRVSGEDLKDPRRLAALYATAMLDSPPESSFDRLTHLTARVLDAPVALVSLVDDRRQFFKSSFGLPEPWAAQRETPLTHSFCQHVVKSGQPLIVIDARFHPVVCNNLAIADLGVVAYLGVPLITADDHILGSLCAISDTARSWTERDIETLTDIAASVMTEFELRTEITVRRRIEASLIASQADLEIRVEHRTAELATANVLIQEAHEQFRQLVDAMPQLAWMARPDGHVYWYNRRWYDYTATTPEQMEGWGWQSVHDPAMLPLVLESWKESIASGKPFEMVFPLRGADGRFRRFLTRIEPFRDNEGRCLQWFGTNTDIEDQKLAEESLAESEERQRLALLAARLAHWQWDVSADETTSQGLTALLGRREDQAVTSTKDFLTLVYPDDVDHLASALERCVRDGTAYEEEFRVVWPDGSVRWLAGKGDVIRDRSGRVVRMAGINVDITEKKFAEAEIQLLNESLELKVHERTIELAGALEALNESERRFRAIFNSTFQFIGLLAPDGTTLEANRTALDFGNVSREDVIGRPFWEGPWWSHSEDASNRVRKAIIDAAGGTFVRYEEDHHGINGETVTVDFSLKPIHDEQGNVVLLIPEGRPITEQKLAAEALRLSEERFRGAFDVSAIGMALVSPEGLWLKVNRALCQIVGYSESEMLTMFMQDVTHPDDLVIELDLVRRACEGEFSSFQLEKRLFHKDGHIVWVIRGVSLVRDGEGDPLHFVAQIEDVSDRKRFETELLRARDDAMAATRAKGDFLANMSHEIRTPMNGVIGMTELLLDTGLNDIQRDYAETIRGSGEALLTVINDILDFSKIEAGKMTLESAEFDLRTLMEEVSALLAPRIHQKGLEIYRQVDPAIPIRLVGDPIRVRQVLTNLAGNAVKFTDHGEVNLDAFLTSDDGEIVIVKISVRDTGIGIPPNRHNDVFESFTQVDEGKNRRHGGTGLGLTICRNLISLMGGTIGLESVPGQGSTFFFELPFGKGSEAIEPPLAAISGLRVLVVDDQETNRTIAREALLSWSCCPDVVGSGPEALAKLLGAPDDDPYGLVLLDHKMPDMDGVQTAKLIKSVPRYAKIPIVLLNSHGSPASALDGGPDLFTTNLTKPIRRSQLYIALCRAVGTALPSRATSTAAVAKSENLSFRLRILLAEDNDVNRRVVIGLAKQLDCEIDAVENGREALEALDYDLHDLVLMDIQMPEMDGLTATSAIRAREAQSGKHIPIIAMTAHAMQGDREKCLDAGMDGYLTKPLRPDALREALRKFVVEGRQPTPPPPIAPPPPSPSTEPSWSADLLTESCGDDPALIAEIMGIMLKGTPERFERLEEAIASRNGRQVAWEAHALKGVFLTVGANALASACQTLIALGERGDFASIEGNYPAVRAQWNQLEAEATRFLETVPV